MKEKHSDEITGITGARNSHNRILTTVVNVCAFVDEGQFLKTAQTRLWRGEEK